tara:strand:+ start:13401 stop:14357 length:957 start_codon:yes stop_codon:yes gene_type:complete
MEIKRSPANPILTVITPTFNESKNILSLFERMTKVLESLGMAWEWLIIDDHSFDDTFRKIQALASGYPNIRGVRLSSNSGTHKASFCGLEISTGDCSIILASDLQDPPELIPELFKEWQKGAQVVWAARNRREGESFTKKSASKVYYMIMKNFVGISNASPLGADFFLLDKKVQQALNKYGETHVSILALISKLGFRQKTIYYDKQKRVHGHSGWTLDKKVKLLLDSVIAFTFKPIRFMSYLGFLTALTGFAYALIVFQNAYLGNPAEGWSSLMVVTLIIGGTQMIMLGVLGEYLWRTLDEARRRPRFHIESDFGFKD